jgi:regulator of protease activity HflC (stomatin/prohibitin superfamily)
MDLSSGAVEVLSVIAGGLVSFFKAFKFVHEGELGVKLRFGRVIRYRLGKRKGEPKIFRPGFVFLIPFLETVRSHHVRQETIRFDHQRIMIKEGLIFDINAIVIFRVTNIYRALFEIEHLEYSIEDLGMGILRDELSSKDHTDLANTARISDALLDNIKHKAEEWGVVYPVQDDELRADSRNSEPYHRKSGS